MRNDDTVAPRRRITAVLFGVLVTWPYAAGQECLAERPPDFGNQWVRTHRFTLMGLIAHQEHMPLLANSGLNTALAWDTLATVPQAANNSGVPWQVGFGAGGAYWPTYADGLQYYGSIPNVGGFIMGDEATTSQQFAAIAAGIAKSKQLYPSVLAYTNLKPVSPGLDFSVWPQYLSNAMTTTQSDVLMFDLYPFSSDGTTRYDFLQQLATIRSAGLEHNVPYFRYTQSWQSDHYNLRMPSDSDMRMDAFASLTMGFKGLAYFTFDSDVGWTDPGLLNTDGSPSPMYANMQSIGPELAHVGASLRMLTSTDIRYVPGVHVLSSGFLGKNITPDGLSDWSVGAGADPHMRSTSVGTGQPGADNNGLVGLFTDDGNNHYFMLSNLHHGGSLSATDASLAFTVTFDSTVNSIWLLNRLTGIPEKIALTNHTLNWTLLGGTGDLFKYDNRLFAGLVLTDLPGDVNFDGVVDISDVQTVAGNWLTTGPTGDANNDNFVDISDVQIIAANWLQSGGSASTVPEPTGCMPACLGAIILWCHVNRRRRCTY